MDTVALVAPSSGMDLAEVVSVTVLSAAGAGLLSTVCPRCAAEPGAWCRSRARHVDRQHDDRYDAWRAAGRPVMRGAA